MELGAQVHVLPGDEHAGAELLHAGHHGQGAGGGEVAGGHGDGPPPHGALAEGARGLRVEDVEDLPEEGGHVPGGLLHYSQRAEGEGGEGAGGGRGGGPRHPAGEVEVAGGQVTTARFEEKEIETKFFNIKQHLFVFQIFMMCVFGTTPVIQGRSATRCPRYDTLPPG